MNLSNIRPPAAIAELNPSGHWGYWHPYDGPTGLVWIDPAGEELLTPKQLENYIGIGEENGWALLTGAET